MAWVCAVALVFACARDVVVAAVGAVFPEAAWQTRTPEQVGLAPDKLMALRELIGGRGCVVRNGYMAFAWGDVTKSADVASAMKPLLSTLLFMAIQERKLRSVDDPVAEVEPQLREWNGGKDSGMTWRHLASQTSGYGLTEKPGEAYSYNDYALALYYDTLMQKVFRTNGTEVLRTRLAEPLQFEDRCTFNAFGPEDRPGRLALSVRDFARFGLLYLHNGQWRSQQLLKRELVAMAINSPLAPDFPRTSGQEAAMLPKQRTIGGTRNITPVGPGFYSFNWWLNRTNSLGQHLFADAPEDAWIASGHGGRRVLFLAPSLDLIVCWNDGKIEDHDQSPGNPNTKMNQAVRLIRGAVMAQKTGTGSAVWSEARIQKPRTVLGTREAQFTLNGAPTFLYGMSYYGTLAAPDDFIRRDLDDLQHSGFNWIRVWANWRAFGAEAAAIDEEGKAIPAGVEKLRWLLGECNRRGMVVDVSLSRGNGINGPPRLQTLEAHRRAVETLVSALRPFRNWYLDLSNERNIQDNRFTSFDDLRVLRARVRELDSERLVTASHAGDLSRNDLREYLSAVNVDFIAPHRPRDAASPSHTEEKTREYFAWMKESGHVVPVHYQEPFRRGFGKWQPGVEDFVTDACEAKNGGAAGWCFHNGDTRDTPDGRPRRSFDLRDQRLFEQLDEEEKRAVEQLPGMLKKDGLD
jgi:CubicO group peptidase (beta-lactamase class C family)